MNKLLRHYVYTLIRVSWEKTAFHIGDFYMEEGMGRR